MIGEYLIFPHGVDGDTRTGFECPHCHQLVQEHKRVLHENQALALLAIGRWYLDTHHSLTAFCKVGDWLKAQSDLPTLGGEYALLKWWGLLEPQEGEREDGSNRVGFWRVTQKGWAFIGRQIAVPAYAWFYNTKPTAWSTELVKIDQCLNRRYRYDEMRGWRRHDE